MRFSRSMNNDMQVGQIDGKLKIILWNFFYDDIYKKLPAPTFLEQRTLRVLFCEFVWKDVLVRPINKMPNIILKEEEFIDDLYEWFFSEEWFYIYDFFEMIFDFIKDFNLIGVIKVQKVFNKLLEREASGYRVINHKIVIITSEGEIAEIEQAITSSDKWKSVNTHLNASLNFLSDRKNPDYRNSIKESISAVESFCRVVLNNTDITFGKALIELEKKHSLHGSLKGAFSALYGYTSDAGGIRHALKEDDRFSNFEDAKFMLVTCSAFINYLKAKMQK